MVDDGKNPTHETVSDTITIIDDDGDNNTSDCMQVAEICTKERLWLKIGCYTLNLAEKRNTVQQQPAFRPSHQCNSSFAKAAVSTYWWTSECYSASI